MNFYQHHIGDFNNATRHLTRLERSIYRDLLEHYYDTEKPLTTDFDRLARRCLVDEADRGTMRDVLNEFFILTDDGYRNARADKEIEAYQRMSQGGKRGAAARWAKGQDDQCIAPPSTPDDKANANHHHEPSPLPSPITKKETSVASAPAGKPAKTDYDPLFLMAWAAYPRREGSSKKDAHKAWSARIKAGVSPIAIAEGLDRYIAYCKANKTEQRYIKTAETFFGPGEHYLGEWPCKPTALQKTFHDLSQMDYTKGVDADGRF